MKRKIILVTALMLLSLSLASLAYGQKLKKMILFPDREYIKKHSDLFFKKVNLSFPPISRVEFFVRTATYPSAYIYLTRHITAMPVFKEITGPFTEKNRETMDRFAETTKKNIRLEGYQALTKELKVSKAQLYLLAMSVLFEEYPGNRLSGNRAFKMWNIMQLLTEDVYKNKKVPPRDRLVILALSSRLVFFKKALKWEKKSKKLLKKLPPGTVLAIPRELLY